MFDKMFDAASQPQAEPTSLVPKPTDQDRAYKGQEEEEQFAILQNTFRFMRIHRLWPRKGEAFNDSSSFYKRAAPLMLTAVPAYAMVLAYNMHLIIDKVKYVPLGENLGDFLTLTSNYCIMLIFLAKANKVAELCKKLSDFKIFGKPPHFDKTNSFLNRLSLMYRVYVLMAITMFIIMSITAGPECERKNKEKGLNELCGTVKGVDLNLFPVIGGNLKPLFMCYQIYMLFVVIGGGTPILFGVVEIATHIVLRIKHLNEMLEEMFDAEASNAMRLSRCIRYHQFIIGTVNDFNACYSIILGSHVMVIAILLGGLGSLLVKEASIREILHLIGWLILLFVVCYSGQIVSSGSDTLAIAAFKSKWYTAEVRDQKTFLFLLTMAQKTLYVYGAPISVISFPLMVQLLKASYSYLTLLVSDE